MLYGTEKEEFIKRVKEYAELKALGYTQDEIADLFLQQYGVRSVDKYRKAVDYLKLMDKINIKVDSEVGLKKIALAKTHLLIDRKISIKQRNLLNSDTNIQAFRDMITQTLVDYKWNTYKVSEIPLKMLKNPKRAVYIIADEHYKGKVDDLHLRTMYYDIIADIKANKYTEVELWYLGDGVDGLIHYGSLASNDGAILPCIQYTNMIIEFINQIPQVKAIKFVCKSNHTQTRPLGTSRNELAKEDLGFVIANTLKHGLRKDIKLQVDDIIFFTYENMKIALLHGHQPYAKSKAKMIEYWSSKYGIIPDITIMGHYHTFKLNEFGNNKWLVVAPTAKQFNGDYEHENGYISSNQYLKLEMVDNIPRFTNYKIGD